MDIDFSPNRVQQASYPMPSSHKSRGEFGIKAIRYVSYPYTVVGEMDIGLSPNRVQQASCLMPHSYKSRGEFGIKAIRYVSYPYAVVGESAIRFLSNRAQKNHRFLFQVHVKHVFFIPKTPEKTSN